MLSVIIPANNESRWIIPCLDALLASDATAPAVEVIVSANACRDDTVALAKALAPRAAARGWTLLVIDRPEPGKLGALNAADTAARWADRVYLDADVTIAPDLLGQLARVLSRPAPVYASGTLVMWADCPLSRRYARLWAKLPFMSESLPGCGLFAVNGAGRARWGDWPDVIADDIFARLKFAPSERVGVPATYRWPVAEGFAALVKVRRRQNAGVMEIARLFPELLANEDKPRLGLARLARLAFGDPLGFGTYGAVSLAVKARPASLAWDRGR